MNWVKSYRLCNHMGEKIYRFIGNCDEISFTSSKEEIFRKRRDARIDYIFDEDLEDELDYINQFLNDFHSEVKFTEMPVAQYSYLDFDLKSQNTNIKNITMSVSSYHFSRYSELKSFLDSRLSLGEDIYVFNYRVYDSFGNYNGKIYHLRCFFITKDLKKEDSKVWIGVN